MIINYAAGGGYIFTLLLYRYYEGVIVRRGEVTWDSLKGKMSGF